jgi:hypothetical protein
VTQGRIDPGIDWSKSVKEAEKNIDKSFEDFAETCPTVMVHVMYHYYQEYQKGKITKDEYEKELTFMTERFPSS